MMAVDPKLLKSLEKYQFEECLQRLDVIVQEMESGKMSLEDMIAKFEEGSALASICHKKLAVLKQKIEMLQPGRENAAQESPQEN